METQGKLAFYATGEGYNNIKPPRFAPKMCTANRAAKIHERNPHFDDPLNPKPINSSKIPPAVYSENHYLKTYKRIGEEKEDAKGPTKTVPLFQVERKKQKIIERQAPSVSGSQAHTKSEFDKLRAEVSKRFSVQRGASELKDNFLYITKNEHLYRETLSKSCNKFGTFEPRKPTETSKDAPGWFGVLEKPTSKVSPENAPTFNGTLTYLSKIQGWITVTPRNKNRSRPLEKAKISGDATKTSSLMPEWMQVKAKRPPENFDVESYFGRKGTKPTRSVYSFMHTRHKVMTKEEAERSNAQACNNAVYRIYQWDENVGKQRYDNIPITGKIGSKH